MLNGTFETILTAFDSICEASKLMLSGLAVACGSIWGGSISLEHELLASKTDRTVKKQMFRNLLFFKVLDF